MTRGSLARRTVGYLVLAQAIAFVLAWSLTLFLGLAGVDGFTQSWDELAAYRTSRLVIESLERDSQGRIFIDPTPGLEAESRRILGFKFAAFDYVTKTPVPGSSPELVAFLSKVTEINSSHTHFVLPGDPDLPALGFMGPKRTPFGRFQIATYRASFRFEDILLSMSDDLLSFGAYFVVATFLSGVTASVAMRQGLLPLQETARQLTQIDFGCRSNRLLSEDVPVEVSPFVDAVNEALIRLDAWATRQRRFTANAAHELRTPLAVMRARLENAQASTLRSDLLSDASQLRSIVEQMLVVARLTDGRVSLGECVDLVETAGNVVSALIPLAIDCERFIDFDAAIESAPVRGNRRAVESVITNLIDNALRAEPIKRAVLVRVEEGPLVSVIDHGDGVSSDHRELIFEPFWRKNDAAPGSGLGLNISKEIIDAHGGRICVEETPGGGATFKILFVPDLGEGEFSCNTSRQTRCEP